MASKTGIFNVSRRTFLKAFSFIGAGLIFTRLFGKLFKHVQPGVEADNPEKKQPPLVEKLVATSCLNCATRCGTIVRVVNGKAVHITGNPLSQVSEGQICPRGHIGLQVLYDPARVHGPLKRTNPAKGRGVDPAWTPVSWEQALNEVSDKLAALRDRAQPHKLALFQGLNTISDEDMIARFARAFGTPNLISSDGLEKQAEITGRWMADGNNSHIAYDIGNAGYILAFGAGILESEKPVTRNLRMWGKIRREQPNRAKIVVIDPRYSVTAVRSDQWLPITPCTDAALALAIANVIISEKLYDTEFINRWTSGFDEFSNNVMNEYSPEKAATITGIDAETIRRIAREFANTKPAIAWVGRGVAAWPGGSYHSYAVYCLNALVGSIDVPGGILYQQSPPYKELPEVSIDNIAASSIKQSRLDLVGTEQFPSAETATNQVPDSILADKPYPVEMAIGFNSNFNMTAPGNRRWEQSLQKIPYYVHIAPFASEMAEYADLLLPSSSFMEEWGYEHSPPGSGFPEVRIKQPAVPPLYDTRSIANIIFEISNRQGGAVAQSFRNIGDNAEGYVKYRTSSLAPWEELQKNGVWTGPPYSYRQYSRIFNTPTKKFEFRSGNLEKRLKEAGQPSKDAIAYLPHYEAPDFIGDPSAYPLMLSVYEPLLNVENGSQNYPWAQDFYLVQHGTGWTTFAEINSSTAHDLGIADGESVWVESSIGRIKVKARVIEGLRPGVVAIATGQGHYAGGKWQQNIGANPNDIIGVGFDKLSGQSSFFNTRVRIYRA